MFLQYFQIILFKDIVLRFYIVDSYNTFIRVTEVEKNLQNCISKWRMLS